MEQKTDYEMNETDRIGCLTFRMSETIITDGNYCEHSFISERMVNMIKVAFAGFEHPHMTGLYNDIKNSSIFSAAGCFEPDEKTRKKAEENGIEFTAADYEELLSDPETDVIAIGSHYAARGRMIIKALKAGKHIIADKPLCTDARELEEIKKLSEEKNLAVCILLSLRKSSSILGALNAVKNGMLGKINNIVFEGEHPLMYGRRADWYFEEGKHGGVINDIAVHGIDMVRLFTGSDVDRVVGAREWNFYAREVPGFLDSAQFVIAMKDGTGVIADVSYSAPDSYGYSHPSYWHFRIFGEKGMLDFREGSPEVLLYPAEGEITEIEPVTPERNLLEEFADIILGGTEIQKYTHEMLESTKQTLLIQQYADKSIH